MLKIIKPGLLTTVQDLGRSGLMKYGVPRSGVMDREAAISANRAIGNPVDAAVLEITLRGPEVEFRGTVRVAIAGARFDLSLNGCVVNASFLAQPGDRLRFGSLRYGCRAYLAVQGGFDVPMVMGSRSTDLRAQFGGHEGRALRSGDVLLVGAPTEDRKALFPPAATFRAPQTLVAVPGPEWESFAEEDQIRVLSERFALSPASDRMGYRLEGPPLDSPGRASLLTSGLVPGTLQITPDGRAVLTMVDAQSTGGYPRLLVLATDQISAAARLKPGDTFGFRLSGGD